MQSPANCQPDTIECSAAHTHLCCLGWLTRQDAAIVICYQSAGDVIAVHGISYIYSIETHCSVTYSAAFQLSSHVAEKDSGTGRFDRVGLRQLI